MPPPPPPPPHSYTTLTHHLLTTHPSSLTPAPPPSLRPKSPSLTTLISSLSLHPTLESTLHLLNADLASAHFLVRHMQSPPAVEGMLLHGILHRIEGDMDNARAWIGDVGDAVEGFVPKRRERGERLEEGVMEKVAGVAGHGHGHGDGEGDGEWEAEDMEGGLLCFVYGGTAQEARTRALGLVDAVEGWRSRRGGESERDGLDARAREELGRVLRWCECKFGTREWRDARSAWVKNSEEIQGISDGMVSGGKGRREF